MGLSLSEPKTDKDTSKFTNEHYEVGVSCMQGWRIEMEDSHIVEISSESDPKQCYLAVFDGHGGSAVAKYAATNLYQIFAENESYKKGNFEAALRKSFFEADMKMLSQGNMKEDSSGATAVNVLLKNGTLYCANAGDSRAILSTGGSLFELSYDHKPNNDTEMQRITKAGGYVEFNRVNGNLALSRALGDFTYKSNDSILAEEQIVTANPDLIVKKLEPGDEFVVLACDGIWDCMTNQEVLEFVRKRLSQYVEPYLICEELMDNCLATEVRPGGVGCDNMSVIIACLLKEASFKDFCTNIRSKMPEDELVTDKDVGLTLGNGENEEIEENNCGEETYKQPNTPLTITSDKMAGKNFEPINGTIVENEIEMSPLASPVKNGLSKEDEIQSLLNPGLNHLGGLSSDAKLTAIEAPN